MFSSMTTTSLVSYQRLEYILEPMKKHLLLLSLFLSAGCNPRVHETALSSTTETNSIVGGQIADNEIFAKHVVAIHNEGLGYWCTGTLISRDTVLTAAHCIDPATESSYTIHFGKNPRTFETITRNVAAVMVNAGYNANAYEDRKDIGIIRFDGGLPTGFEPMPLPTVQDFTHIGNTFYAAGYGTVTARTDIPRGSGSLRYTTQTFLEGHITPTQTQFLVDQRNGHGICYGDSGGPAFVRIGNRRVVIGIASAIYSTDTAAKKKNDFDLCRYSAIYTNVIYYMDWIKKASASLH
jgi:secreted trypsin-like serine protease